MSGLAELKATVDTDPGNPVFVEVAKRLIEEGSLQEALGVCLRGVSQNPSLPVGRLALARVFYEMDLVFLAAREVELLSHELPHLKSLASLLDKLGYKHNSGGSLSMSEGDETVAEMELDFDELGGDREGKGEKGF